ncbi:38105_t:CDS:2, partial [Gigaspora margarita]
MTTATRPIMTVKHQHYNTVHEILQLTQNLNSEQLTKEELENIDFKEELLKAEREHFEKMQGEQLREAGAAGENQYTETQHQLLLETAALDKDDITVNSVFSDEEEEEDDTAALLLELEKIKKE